MKPTSAHREPNSTYSRRDAVLTLAAGCAGMIGGGRQRFPALINQEREIVVRNGRVVNADGVRDADVRIVGETIVEVGPSVTAGRGARVIDAERQLVLPGGVDPHTHLHPSFVDDLTTGTSAAVAGGITTVGTFAFGRGDESVMAAVARMGDDVANRAIGDVILHASTWPPTDAYRAALPALAARGQPSIKVFMARRDFGQHLEAVITLLEQARTAGIVTLVHCEDGAMLAAAVRKLEAEGRTTLRDYAASRPVIAEVAATEQAVALCELTGAPMHVVHLSSARALDAIRNPAATGLPLSVETRPLYLYFTDERFLEPDGPLYVGQPPLRTPTDAETLWRGLIDGRIDMLATDHAPWTRAQKLDPALTVSRLRPGVSSLRFMLPIYFSEGVVKRDMPLTRFVETTSTSAAKIFGLFPRKGVIREGALADIVILDPDLTKKVRAADDPSRADYTLYEGWEVTGWPVVTIRRGEVVFENDTVVGRPGSGQLMTRAPRSA